VTGPPPNFPPSWNVAPTTQRPVIRRHPDAGDRRLDLLAWGLVLHFTKGLKAARKPISARAETVATSGMPRGALTQRRCLVPADAFYEWRAIPDGKQPYAIARRDGRPMAFAGLREGWRAPDGLVLRAYTSITTAASSAMAQAHDRMPVVLKQEDWPAWLGEEGGGPAPLLRPAADDVLRLWPVSRAVNSVRNNGAELQDVIHDPHAPPPSNAPAGPNPA